MKFLILVLMAMLAVGCSSTPKILMKNCTKLSSGYYECEEVRDRKASERR